MMFIAFAVLAASIPVAVLVAFATRRLSAAVPVMLDLWVPAGLLRLSESGAWSAIAGAAALIAIRKVVVSALSRHP